MFRLLTIKRGQPVQPVCCDCKRPLRDQDHLVVTVFKWSVIISEPGQRCPSCWQRYLAAYSTYCNACGGLIVPGNLVVEAAGQFPRYPFVHAEVCGKNRALACGRWGEDKYLK